MVLNISFLNRERKLRALSALAHKDRSSSDVLFLRAPSGLGKSSIVDHFIQKEPQLKAVRVPMLDRIGGERLDDINHIVRQIDRFAERTKWSARLQSF
jgi:hypothetical protein